jgi:hypothetical protein
LKKKINVFIQIILLFTILSCTSNLENKANFKNYKIDTLFLKQSYSYVDTPSNEFLNERLKPIREIFLKLNSVKKDNWSKIETKKLNNTIESGEATYYYWNNSISKIVTKQYAEIFQILTEYYILDNQLSFSFEKKLNYNRPIYYNSNEMKTNNDTEKFDITKSEIIEVRNYFEKGKLINQINNQDCGSPMAEDYLKKEEMKIKGDFEKLFRK